MKHSLARIALCLGTLLVAGCAEEDGATRHLATGGASTESDGTRSAEVPDETLVAAGAGAGDDGTEDDDDGPDDPDQEPAGAPTLTGPAKPITVTFNAPEKPGDRALEKGFEELVAMTPPGASIRVALYQLTRSSPAKALVAAAKRGVDVKLVLDGQNAGNTAVTLLAAGLPAGALTLCKRGRGSCIGTGINHNKLALFSALGDGSKNVVWQSSANLTGGQLTVHNNTVVVRDDAALFAGYAKYFRDLAAQKANPDYYTVVEGAKTKAYFFPRAEGDTVLGILDNVVCKKNKSTVRIAMGFFLDSRISVAKKLVALASAGCNVEVLLNADAEHAGAKIASTLAAGGVKVRTFNPAAGGGRLIHSKYLLIDSAYGNDASAPDHKLVFTGSHNYIANSLRANDETLLRVDDAAGFGAFAADYGTIRGFTK